MGIKFEAHKEYAKKYNSYEVDRNIILYEARDGNSVSDSPLAIFEYLNIKNKYSNFKHVWVINNLHEESYKTLHSVNSNVIFVKRNTKEYIMYLLKAKYLINNSTFPSFFIKKNNQIYINTWHGTPLKKMGFDISDEIFNNANVERNILMTDYFLSPNKYTTEIFINAYRLNGAYGGEIIETGYPRLDFTVNGSREGAINILKLHGLILDQELDTIAYVPTWRGNSAQSPKDSIDQVIAEFLFLRKKLIGKYNVLLKVHPFIFEKVKNNEKLKGKLIPDYIDINKVLPCIDLLITDYSSVIFDYLTLKRPIIYYNWDADLFSRERGMYFDTQLLPGPVAYTIHEVLHCISQKVNQEIIYDENTNSFLENNDGKISKRVVEYIFDQKNTEVKLIKFNNDKKKIIIYPGNFSNNGITVSLINLINSLDTSLYDITLFMNPPSKIAESNLDKIRYKTRFLFRVGNSLYSKNLEKVILKLIPNRYRGELLRKIYSLEIRRLFANLNFDVAIDFSGYSYFWAKFIAFSNANKKIIYMHNDLKSESHKIINGRKPHLKNLTNLFLIYNHFDMVINVSSSLLEVNYSNLRKRLQRNKMFIAENIVKISENNDFEDKEYGIEKHLKRYKLAKNRLIIYPNIENMDKYVEKNFLINSFVMAIAKYTKEQQIFVKLLIDNVYEGWTNLDNLVEIDLEIQIKNVFQIASIKKTDKFYLFGENFPSLKNVVTSSEKLVTNYFFVKEYTNIDNIRYAFISNSMGIEGWINSVALTHIHKFSRYNPIFLYFLYKNKKNTIKLPKDSHANNIRDRAINSRKLIKECRENEKIITFCVGRLSPEKNHINLIHAIKKVATRIPNIILFIIGEGALRGDLIEEIERLGLTENVKMLGYINNPTTLMKEDDFFVFPSYYEGQGMALIEALSIGMHIITSPIPTSKEILDRNSIGSISKGYDSDSLASAIIFSILNKENAGYNFDLDLYNESALKKFEKIIR
ncbi:CDP-glycerol glycerophosphotransferase family protein [Lactococcus formosensis]|uniref:CDP-glycerol glycerophosphotransferase family protein n=1 Tax=Lactococcus formosensis TaxID=1281486 RepID=UPI002434F512|nr:CDP-glycerol glycerophosphotransferase family protein [Lactococcus formosensis]MDG6126094.1 CDP-glycerol glycerophosphotransferase family protein [Lactococcus formosensis]MDG6187897.1 CDP-glycerol glycerophosphotransferase family protein [Lactococcus formosensis]